jgi:electron transport complex protein RnfG
MHKKIWLPLLSLILAAVILLGLYNGLNGIRASIREEELQNKMQTILPGSTTFTEEAYDGEDTNIQFVYKGETGFVVGTRTAGYAGDILMLIGVSSEGSVTGLQVRSMEETYGLGGEALTDWEFLAQFLRNEGDAEIGVNVDAITGATVTSKAIARSVNSAVGFVTGADVSSSATTWGG